MQPQFLNQSHFIDPAEKDELWAATMIEELYNYGGAESLLADKDARRIRQYANGQQPVNRYKKMFKRMKKEIEQHEAENAAKGIFSTPNLKDITGIDWEPLGMLSQPLNSALSVVQKQPIYVKATAIDALAMDKKQADYKFIANRPHFDRELNNISQKLGTPLAPPQVPNNAENADIANFDLDPSRPDELNFYINMFYKLRPESAFETVLMACAYMLNLRQVRDLESRDQLYYGVSTNDVFFSDITGLPEVEYVYPGDVYTPYSDLPDYTDVTHRYRKRDMTADDLMNRFGSQLSEDQIGEKFDLFFEQRGYNFKWKTMDTEQKRKQTMPVIFMEWKSWDTINFHRKKKEDYMISEVVGYNYELKYSNGHPNPALRGKPKVATPEEFINKKYIQNTYTAYWLPCDPPNVYKFKKLEGAAREPGKESLSPFRINIHKSQAKGVAELAIPIIDDCQRAYFKMQHAIIMSKPKGSYVDLRFLRNAVTQLTSTDFQMTLSDLVSLFAENNILLGDSEGMDPNELQSGARPFYDMPGGVGRDEIEGYLKVIDDGFNKISRLTGINDALTGQSANPDGLVGLQKLLLQSSINSLYYVQFACKSQTEKVFKMWAHQIQHILKHRNSPSGRQIEAIVGSYKVNALVDLHTIPAHQFGIMVENAPTEEQQNELNQMLMEMFKTGRITTADFVTLRRVFNYKDAQQLLAIRERKQMERSQQIRQEEQQAAQQQVVAKEQGKLGNTKMQTEAGVQEEMIKSQTQKWLAQFNANMEAKMLEFEGRIKNSLQDRRQAGSIDKAREQSNLKAQEVLK